MPPLCCSIRASTSRRAWISVTSQPWNEAPVSDARAAPPSASMSMNETRAPCATKAFTISSPIPEAPPVITTDRPSQGAVLNCLIVQGHRNLRRQTAGSKRCSGRPATSTRMANRLPECGRAASSAAGRLVRAEVTYRVLRSGPPKATIVGQRAGTGYSARSVHPVSSAEYGLPRRGPSSSSLAHRQPRRQAVRDRFLSARAARTSASLRGVAGRGIVRIAPDGEGRRIGMIERAPVRRECDAIGREKTLRQHGRGRGGRSDRDAPCRPPSARRWCPQGNRPAG